MRVTLLGTGSAIPSPHRLQAGILLEDDSRTLLVDCGSGVVHRLAQHGTDVREVDTVLLTHHHLDHVADLPTLLKARVLTDHPGLTIVGPPGTKRLCDDLFAVDNLAERAALRIRERAVSEAPFDVAGRSVDAVETTHSMQCFAYRFDDELVMSGDTAPDPAVFNLADGVDTLIHECAYPDGVETDGHTTPTALGRGLGEIRVDRVLLTHLFPEAEAHSEAIERTVSAATGAVVAVGSDLSSVEVPA